MSSIQPLISVIEHLRRELAWGLSHDDTQSSKAPEFTTLRPKAPSSDAFSASIEPTVVSLGHSILDSMKCVESTVKLAYNRSGGHSPFSRGDWTSRQSQILSRCDQNLTGSYSEAKRALEAAVKIWHTEADSIHSQEDAKQDVLDGCLAMVALLQVCIFDRFQRVCLLMLSRLRKVCELLSESHSVCVRPTRVVDRAYGTPVYLLPGLGWCQAPTYLMILPLRSQSLRRRAMFGKRNPT